MKAVVQRVRSACVRVDGRVVGSAERGVLVLLGVMRGDREEEARRLADRVLGLRIFDDGSGRMNASLAEVGGDALVVSQFTLAADGRKGRRPSFDRAAAPQVARPLYEAFAEALRAKGTPVQTGVFGARMAVEMVGDGPVTLVLDLPPPGGPDSANR